MLIRKPRVRFQFRKKKGKRDGGRKAQREPVRTTHVGNPETTLIEGIDEQPLFVKKWCPSIGDPSVKILRSNLSTSLAAAKASSVMHSATCPPSTPTGDVITQPQERDDDPPASLLELAPMYRPVDDHVEAMNFYRFMDDEGDGDDGPSASLLATTAIYRPVDDRFEPAAQTPSTAVSTAESCAIKDDDEPQVSHLVNFRESLVNYIEPAPWLVTEPPQASDCYRNVLQGVSNPQKLFSLTATNPPSTTLPRRTVSDLNLPPRRSIPRRHLPLPPPVLVAHRPYRPVEENLNEPFIAPAREHEYTGDYSVAEDLFDPTEIHQGFTSPTSSLSPMLAHRRQNSAETLLDRDTTVWGKWYAKTPTPESLPFAKAKDNGRSSGLDQELTEQQVWDAHCNDLIRAHSGRTSDMSESQLAEVAEQERAARLRHHQGHCFGALTGDVYPFQRGRII